VSDPRFVPLAFERMSDEEQLERSARFLARMRERRTVRDFSRESVPGELVLNAVATAGTAPSGAHQQPWTFVVVSDPDVKRRIRVAAEEEERRSYEERMPDEWLEALRALGTGWRKPHLEDARRYNERARSTTNSPSIRAYNHYVRAEIDNVAGDWTSALRHYQECIALSGTAGSRSASMSRPACWRA
jgi:nitroreductase